MLSLNNGKFKIAKAWQKAANIACITFKMVTKYNLLLQFGTGEFVKLEPFPHLK